MKSYNPYHFALFRILLGVYLLQHFIGLIPYGTEVFSNEGIFPRASLNFTHGAIPGLFDISDSPSFVTGVLVTLSVLALLFTIGFKRNWVALLLWVGWISLFGRNNLISNPGLPFIGFLLLVSAVLPTGEPLALDKTKENWRMPPLLFYGAWAIMAVSYTISGFDKWIAPSWRDGSAIIHLLNNPLARDTPFREWFLMLPESILHLKTWAILAMEALFLPLALLKRTRPFAWLGMVLMHFGIIAIVDFADLTVGMLMIHVFTFDSRWMKSALTRRKANPAAQRIVFFDGVCSICNSTVDFLMNEDEEGVLKFASLQGETAKQHAEVPQEETPGSIIYFREGTIHSKSSAVLLILKDLGGLWRVLSFLRIIPKPIRNAVYDLIARNRYKWFGKKETCRMPTAEERGRLLG
ncbi:MAG: DCC1-like thiol-disulfide oxidoreductase family protein [Flavobacteriales bacterium]|nr:DCC1-like thiol-disulfide oxidoreductase family protein [Flavobacteriales bacterium]